MWDGVSLCWGTIFRRDEGLSPDFEEKALTMTQVPLRSRRVLFGGAAMMMTSRCQG